MYWIKIVLITIGCFLASITLHGQELLSLREAQALALEEHLGILIAQDRLDIAALNNSRGEAGMLPWVSWQGNANTAVNNSRQQFFTGEERAEPSAANLGIQTSIDAGWTIFDGKAMFYRKDRLNLLEQMSKLEFQNRSFEVLTDVTLDYFEIVQQEKAIAVLENTINLTREFFDLATARMEIGTGTELDVLQFRNEIKADSVRLNIEQNRLRQLKIQLNRSMQQPPGMDYMVDTGMTVNPGLVYTELLESAKTNNFSMLFAQQELLITEVDKQLANSGRYPTLDLNGGFAYNYSTSQVGVFQSNRSFGPFLGVTARMNLFDGNRVNRQIERVEIQSNIAQKQFSDVQFQIETAVYSAYEQYRTYLNQIRLEAESREIAQQNLDLAQQMFRLGRISNIEVREARRSLLGAESRYLNAQLLAKEAEMRLLYLSGLIQPEE